MPTDSLKKKNIESNKSTQKGLFNNKYSVAIITVFSIIVICIIGSPVIILFLLILTLIVCIHEFGHFITAKKFEVDVEEFSIGMGPLVVKKDYKGTQYSIRALPIGGYVKMLGEGEASDKIGSFSKLKPWKRFIIIYAGVVMNFVLVAIIFTIFGFKSNFTYFGVSLDENYKFPIGDSGVVKQGISGVEDNSPAKQAGIKSLDIINKANGQDYKTIDDYRKIIGDNVEKNIPFEITSYLGGGTKTVSLTPRDRTKSNLSDTQTNTGIVQGVTFSRVEFHGWSKPFAGILQTINATHNYVSTIGTIINVAITRKDSSIIVNSVSSPVGTYAVTQKVLNLEGFWGILSLTAFISLAIGLMNAFPFPALDGWHGFFIIIEMITGKRINEKLYNAITIGGFVLLLALGILISIKDVLNFSTLFG